MTAPFERAPAAAAVWHATVCARKRRFPDRARAQRSAERVRSAFGDIQDPYECPVCAGWHLRSRDKRRQKCSSPPSDDRSD